MTDQIQEVIQDFADKILGFAEERARAHVMRMMDGLAPVKKLSRKPAARRGRGPRRPGSPIPEATKRAFVAKWAAAAPGTRKALCEKAGYNSTEPYRWARRFGVKIANKATHSKAN